MSDDENKIKKPLDEITGVIGSVRTTQQGQGSTGGRGGGSGRETGPSSRSRGPKTGMTMDACHSLRGWQNEVVQRLKQGRDVYIATSPGSGKTMPIMCYWGEDILNLRPRQQARRRSSDIRDLAVRTMDLISNPENFEKVVYFCPVRALVDDISLEFRKLLASLFSQAMQIIFDNLESRPLQNFVETSLIGNRSLNLDDRYLSGVIRNLRNLDNEIDNLTRDSRSGREEQKRIQHLRNQRANIVQDLQNRISQALRSRLKKLVATRSEVHKDGDPNEALVTVSVVGSAKRVMGKEFSSRALDRIRLMAFDEAHLFQEEKNRIDQSARDRVENLYLSLKKTSGNKNMRIALMTGTAHPDAVEDLVNYMKKCFNRNFSIISPSEAKNQAQIDVVANDKVTDENFQINLLTNPDSENNLLIIFSKRRILDLTRKAIKRSDKATLASVDRGAHRKNVSEYPQRKLSPEDQNNEFSPEEIAQKATEIPGAENIYENLQKQAVSAGFGFIIRPDNRDDIDTNNLRRYVNDVQIVASLFREGKIHTLMSTHAVGVGVNIYVKKLYIPTIVAPGERGFEKMGTAVSSQLFNRVGRAAFPIGTIVTSTEHQEDVMLAMSAGQSEFERGVNVDTRKMKCNMKTFMGYLANAIADIDNAWVTGGQS